MTIKRKRMITGSLIAGVVLGTVSLNAAETNLFNYNELGSGSVVRVKLLKQTDADFKAFLLELNCGEKTKKETEARKTKQRSPKTIPKRQNAAKVNAAKQRTQRPKMPKLPM